MRTPDPEKGPAARPAPKAGREAYSLYVSARPRGPTKQMGPYRGPGGKAGAVPPLCRWITAAQPAREPQGRTPGRPGGGEDPRARRPGRGAIATPFEARGVDPWPEPCLPGMADRRGRRPGGAPATAQEATSEEPVAQRIDPIVQIGTKIDTPVSDVPSAITVIPGEEIARKRYTNVGDVLRAVPGVQIQSAGGLGNSPPPASAAPRRTRSRCWWMAPGLTAPPRGTSTCRTSRPT